MKKFLLLAITLLTMGGVANAQLQYEIDQEFKSIDALNGQKFMIVNATEGKAIYNSDNQNLKNDTYSAAMTGTGPYFKLEAGPEIDGNATYKFLVVNASGNNVGLWGNSSIYLNSGKEGGFNGCFVLGNGSQNGTDVENGGIWYVEYVAGNGWTLKNVARGGYFAGVNPAPTGEDPIYWTFCTVKEKVVEDLIDPRVKDCPTEEGWKDMIINGTCDKKTTKNKVNFWLGAVTDDNKNMATIESGAGRAAGNGIKITSKAGASQPWDTQFFIKANEPLPAGTKLHVEFDYKASQAAKITTQIQAMPSHYTSNPSIGDVNCGLSWQHFEKEIIIGEAVSTADDHSWENEPVQSIAFNLNENKTTAIDFYFDNFVMWAKDNAIEKPAYAGEGAKIVSFDDVKAVADGATWDADAKTVKGWGGFQWTEGLDASEYRYLVITTAKNMSNGGYVAYIQDKNGVKVQGDEYGANYMNMWFGQWNHHNCMSIDLEKLRINKEFDVYNITDLVFDGGNDGLPLETAYLTNQKPNNDKNWGNDPNGDFKVADLPDGKYGTICLAWPAVAACATVYEISGKDESGIWLSKVEGIMEAGKPYIYQNNGNNASAEKNSVFFYKAYDATVDKAGENNGLIGTFTATDSEKAGIAKKNFAVLSNGQFYNLEGATGDDKVTIKANRAYLNWSKVESIGGGDAKIFFDFEEAANATGIEETEIVNTLNDGKFYDLSGREVTNPTKGVYIVNGKKVVIK